MVSFARFLQFLSLGVWLGGILYFGAIVAPAAFTVLQQDQAGALIGLTLGRLHLLGLIAGIVYLLGAALAERSAIALVRPASVCVLLMIVLTFISQFWVISTMEALRAQMGSVAATPATNAMRASFDRLHTLSVRLEGGVLVAGLVALALISRRPAS